MRYLPFIWKNPSFDLTSPSFFIIYVDTNTRILCVWTAYSLRFSFFSFPLYYYFFFIRKKLPLRNYKESQKNKIYCLPFPFTQQRKNQRRSSEKNRNRKDTGKSQAKKSLIFQSAHVVSFPFIPVSSTEETKKKNARQVIKSAPAELETKNHQYNALSFYCLPTGNW